MRWRASIQAIPGLRPSAEPGRPAGRPIDPPGGPTGSALDWSPAAPPRPRTILSGPGAGNQRHSFNVAPTDRLSPEEVMLMSREGSSREGRSLRGFARMEPNKQRELARKGGANVPSEKRS